MYYDESNTSTSSLKSKAWDGKEKEQEYIPVGCITLNEFINMEVDLLKMDIEGLENEVLLNSKKALKYVSNIIFEFHYSKLGSFDKMLKFLKSCGFYIKENSKPKVGEMCIVKCSRYKF